jgi:hypothetical protein
MASAVIRKKQTSATIKAARAVAYGIIQVTGPTPAVKVTDILPYRIRFTNIGIPSYRAFSVPPIGIQVIGYSNWII